MTQTLTSLVWIMAVAAFIPLILGLLRWRVAAVALLLAGGALLGPEGLGLVHLDDSIELLAALGLGVLFFLAGAEIDRRAISGISGRLAAIGWLLSIGIASVAALVLAQLGIINDGIGYALALTSTALGTLLPSLRDSHEVKTPFGTFFLGAGAWGEFGPLVGIAILLSAETMWRASLTLIGFLVFAIVLAVILLRFATPTIRRVMAAGHSNSSQTAVRFTLLVIILLLALAAHSGLDLVLGAFIAGIIVRRLIGDGEHSLLIDKIETIGFGFLIPIFFVVSGVRLDVKAVIHAPTLVLSLFLMLAIIRGAPQWFLYRRALPDWRERTRFSLYVATGLPIIIALVDIEVATGAMRPINGSALICAGALSVLVFPLAGDLVARRRSGARGGAQARAE